MTVNVNTNTGQMSWNISHQIEIHFNMCYFELWIICMIHENQHVILASMEILLLTNDKENKKTSWYKGVGQGFVLPDNVASNVIQTVKILWTRRIKETFLWIVIDPTLFPSALIVGFLNRLMVSTWIIFHFFVLEEIFLKSQACITIVRNTFFKEIIHLFVRKPMAYKIIKLIF